MAGRIAAETGHEVLRPGRSRRSLATLALSGEVAFAGSPTGGYIFPDFLASTDAVMSMGMVTRMLATDGRTLDEIVDALPAFHKRTIAVFCPVDRKGVVLARKIDTGQTAQAKTLIVAGISVATSDTRESFVMLIARTPSTSTS